MAKSKKKKRPNSSEAKSKEKGLESKEPESDDNFDFGGLPKRDLKKNLGCG